MAISTFCLGCRSLLRLPDELAGQQVRCQKCNQLLTVPGLLTAAPKKAAAPAVQASPRPEPMPAAAPAAPPTAPPAVVPRATAPPPRPEAAPPSDGLPAVVLVEVPTRPTPPPLPEEREAPRPIPTERGSPPRREIPAMNLSGRAQPRRNNRPRRPASVLAGLMLTLMVVLFCGLFFTSGVIWLATAVSARAHQNNVQFVQQQQQQQQPFQGQPFPPNGGGFQGGGPMIGMPLPQARAEGGKEGAVGEGAVFNPGPPGPRFAGPMTKIDLKKGLTVVNGQLTPDDQFDLVRRPPFQVTQCKVFAVRLEANKRYTLDYTRPLQPNKMAPALVHDPYLRIENEDGVRLVENDDVRHEKDMNSQITFIPQKTATYRVFCTFFQFPLRQGQMQFTLAIREDLKPLPQPQAANESLAGVKRTDGEVGIVALANPREFGQPAADICWAPDKRAFFVIYSDGTLARVALDSGKIERRLSLRRQPGNLGMVMSGQGLVVSLPGQHEVWLIDPETLAIKKRYGGFPAYAIASAPGLNYAFVATRTEFRRGFYVLDLARDTPIRFVDAPIQNPVATPDGTMLFVMDNAALVAYRIKRDGLLEFRQIIGPLGFDPRNARRIEVSSDSAHVCVSGATRNVALRDHRFVGACPAYVYSVKDLRKPVCGISTGIPLRAVGFDPRANRIFAHATGKPVVVFDGAGKRKAEFTLGNPNLVPLQFLTHPAGNRVLIRFADQICLATFKPANAPVVKVEPKFPQPTAVNAGDAEAVAGMASKNGKASYRVLDKLALGDIDPIWDADGQAILHVDSDGTLTRIGAGDFMPKTRLAIGQPVAAMALSQRGLLVALRDQAKVWLIEPRTLKVQRRFDLAAPAKYLASHPKLAVAAVVGNEAVMLDLNTGAKRPLAVVPEPGHALHNPAIVADGSYLFLNQAGGGVSKVLRVNLKTDGIDTRAAPVKGVQAFCITADAKHVAWFSPSSPNKKQETEFYKVGDWQASAFTIPQRASAMAAANGGGLLVHTHQNRTLYFAHPATGDMKTTPLPFLEHIRSFAPQPGQPGAFLASNGKTVFYVERQGP